MRHEAPKRSHKPLTHRNEDRFDGAARMIDLVTHVDPRGVLIPVEFEHLPFHPRALFTVQGVPPGTVRGRHAHRQCTQLLVCLAGAIRVKLRREGTETEVDLDDPTRGLLVSPGVWSSQTYLVPDTILLVVASHRYTPDDYLDQESA